MRSLETWIKVWRKARDTKAGTPTQGQLPAAVLTVKLDSNSSRMSNGASRRERKKISAGLSVIDAVDLHRIVDQRPGAVVVVDGDGECPLAHGHPASRKAASIMASTTQPAISSTSRSAEPQMSLSTT